MPYSGHEIIEATSGTLLRGSAAQIFADVSTDTRERQGGKLFIPLPGPRFDGHDFVAAAVRSGAIGLLIRAGEEYRLREIERERAVTVIGVRDTLTALGDVAHFWRKKFHLPVVAITGSAGKTTTKEMTAQILGQVKNTLQTEGNFNNLVGLPLTLFRLREAHEVAILEMGTNVPGEIARLSQLAAPDVGLITNIGPAHLEGLKSVDLVKEEMGELFRHLAAGGTAVVNGDDEAVRELAARRSGRQITYGLRGRADVTATEVTVSRQGLSFLLMIGPDQGRVQMAAAGTHNLMNALAAAAISKALEIPLDVISRGLQLFQPIPGRMEIIALKNGSFLINDSYNANPVSVREALLTFQKLRAGGRGTVILGDMLELGEQADAWHEQIGGLLASTEVSRVFLRGAYARMTAAGAEKQGLSPSRISFPSAPEDIVAELSSSWQEGDWLLVKGSRAMKMDEIVAGIIEKFGRADEGPAILSGMTEQQYLKG
jgi:UDP-N-acetylmuramoyl-tripeptide--D-alanyl-D-alanine ligase